MTLDSRSLQTVYVNGQVMKIPSAAEFAANMTSAVDYNPALEPVMYPRYVGTSGDSKPTASVGSEYYETDTGKVFITNGSTWSLKPGIDGGTVRSGALVADSSLAQTIVRTFANPTASGSTQLVAASTGKKIRVIYYNIINSGTALNVKFQSATTDISSTKPFLANSGQDTTLNIHGLFETAVGEALNVNLSTGAVAPGVAIELLYVLI